MARPIPLDSWEAHSKAVLGRYVPILNVENPPTLSPSELFRLGFTEAARTLANDLDYNTHLHAQGLKK